MIEQRSAEGRFERLPALAAELAWLKVDVIVGQTTPPARDAKQATSTSPIIFAIVSRPAGSRLVTNLSRPDANVTGMTDMGVGLAGKQLDLLKQLLPRL